jgi:hypothetical protein
MKTKFVIACFSLLSLLGLGSAAQAQTGPVNGGNDGKAKIKALIKKLDSEDEDVRFKAARALGKFGPQAKMAVPGLTRLAKDDPDEDVREAAKSSLKKIKGAPVVEESEAPAKEFSVVGTWKGTTKIGNIPLTITSVLKKDGTYQTTWVSGNVITAAKGTYEYSDGVLTTTPVGGFVSQTTITWVDENHLVCTGNGMKVDFYRQK